MLFDTLVTVNREPRRHVDLIARAGVLGDKAVFVKDPVPGRAVTQLVLRRAARTSWWAAARKAVSGVDVVFLDPDNGLRPPSAIAGRAGDDKYAGLNELDDLVTDGHAVLIYQHLDRTMAWQARRAQIVARIRDKLKARSLPDPMISVVQAAVFGGRAFILVTNPSRPTQGRIHNVMRHFVATANAVPGLYDKVTHWSTDG